MQTSKTKNLVLLGASGSIGKTTLNYLNTDKNNESYDIKIVAISIHTSISFLQNLNLENFKYLKYICISSDKNYEDNQNLIKKFKNIKFFFGSDGLIEMLEVSNANGADTVLIAIVGSVGIKVTLKAIQLGMKIALANKESLVLAGKVIQNELIKNKNSKNSKKAFLIPVDSEHNSLFRIIEKINYSSLSKIILTASGGSLRDLDPDKIRNVTKAEVLKHPNWEMGAKITIDSASLINKGLEIIEAHFLFNIDYDNLDAYIHRDSIVHAIIESKDGSYFFHASYPDMSFPIAHSLFYPEEEILIKNEKSTSPLEWNELKFSKPDAKLYPGFYLCKEVGKIGRTAPAIFNAANEVAVSAFLEDRINFTQIIDVIKEVIDCANFEAGEELEIFLSADNWARVFAKNVILKLNN